MIGMAMRDNHAQHRQPAERIVENLLPARLDLFVRNATVDHRPTLTPIDAIAQQPQIDVIQRERQRHARPHHAGGHLPDRAAGRQGIAHRVVQLLLQSIHEARSPEK